MRNVVKTFKKARKGSRDKGHQNHAERSGKARRREGTQEGTVQLADLRNHRLKGRNLASPAGH